MRPRLAQPARRLALCLTVLAASGTAGAQPADALAELRREGRIACQPDDVFFCANMHVSCAGRTTVATFPFLLRLTTAGGALEAPAGAEPFVERYSRGRVDWGAEGQYVIFRPAAASGYIKLFRDDKYVFRHYPQHDGVMSLGRCG